MIKSNTYKKSVNGRQEQVKLNVVSDQHSVCSGKMAEEGAEEKVLLPTPVAAGPEAADKRRDRAHIRNSFEMSRQSAPITTLARPDGSPCRMEVAWIPDRT